MPDKHGPEYISKGCEFSVTIAATAAAAAAAAYSGVQFIQDASVLITVLHTPRRNMFKTVNLE